MPNGACSSRVSRAVNGAMVEVSGNKQHSGLPGFIREHGPDFCIFDGQRRSMASEMLSRMSEFLDA